MGKKKARKKNSLTQSNNQKIIPIAIMLIGVIGLLIWGISSFSGKDSTTPTEAQVTGGVQEIFMSLTPAGYSPNNITVKEGIPVKINTDSTADAGCVRGVMIPDFNINVALDVGRDFFTFTPDKKGTFPFSCQMRMSTGTITVI